LSPVRFCLIGAGRAGLVHAENVARRIPDACLAALCDANPEALNTAADRYGVEKRYADFSDVMADPDIDAVIIVTPTFLHCRIACAAAESGKHVFLEKPMAITVEECEAINQAVAKADVRLQLGFMRRFDKGFQRVKEVIASGELGAVMTVKSIGRGPGLPPPWIYDLKKSNGILAEVNSHDFDTVRWLAGDEAARVFAQAGNFKCADARDGFPDFYDNAIVSLKFARGALGTVDGTCPCHYGYDARVEALCERGLLQAGTVKDGSFFQAQVNDVKVTGEGTVLGSTVKSWRNVFKDAYLDEMEHFIACVREGKTPAATGKDGLEAVRLVAAANKSILTGDPIAIDRSDS